MSQPDQDSYRWMQDTFGVWKHSSPDSVPPAIPAPPPPPLDPPLKISESGYVTDHVIFARTGDYVYRGSDNIPRTFVTTNSQMADYVCEIYHWPVFEGWMGVDPNSFLFGDEVFVNISLGAHDFTSPDEGDRTPVRDCMALARTPLKQYSRSTFKTWAIYRHYTSFGTRLRPKPNSSPVFSMPVPLP